MSALQHRFGGRWTNFKVELVRHYLGGYQKVLQNTAFRTHYIDPFAGSGDRTDPALKSESDLQLDFPFELDREEHPFAGAARLAMEVNPPFSTYVLNDLDPKKAAALEQLARDQFSSRPESQRPKTLVFHEDANSIIEMVCRSWDPQRDRGVAFLDPYGMQLDWVSMEHLANTRAIDVWVLVGIDMGMNRLLTDGGVSTPAHRDRLTRFFGTDTWMSELFRPRAQRDLFQPPTVERRSVQEVMEFYQARLKATFAAVAPNPRVLYNKAGRPLYMLCFAVANPGKKAQEAALRIASSLLRRPDGKGKRD